jgi:hypothetical protein
VSEENAAVSPCQRDQAVRDKMARVMNLDRSFGLNLRPPLNFDGVAGS